MYLMNLCMQWCLLYFVFSCIDSCGADGGTVVGAVLWNWPEWGRLE
jgi:hypothetical protein